MEATKVKVSQTTISKKQENKGAKAIIDLTSTMGQVLKQFMGIYGQTLPECDGMTVESWMNAHGVYRFVGKNGKKGNYTPALLVAGWHDDMKHVEGKDTVCYVFKNVPGKIELSEPGDPDGVSYRVFTWDEANKVDGKPISRYMQVAVASNKWNVPTIMKGLKQKNNFAKENDKAVDSDLAWGKLEKVYIVKMTKVDGEIKREVVEVSKDRVVF